MSSDAIICVFFVNICFKMGVCFHFSWVVPWSGKSRSVTVLELWLHLLYLYIVVHIWSIQCLNFSWAAGTCIQYLHSVFITFLHQLYFWEAARCFPRIHDFIILLIIDKFSNSSELLPKLIVSLSFLLYTVYKVTFYPDFWFLFPIKLMISNISCVYYPFYY